MKRLLVIWLFALSYGSMTRGADHADEPPGIMKIRIKAGGKILPATLSDTASAKDFFSLLPLTLTLKDYAQSEKISDLPQQLNTTGAPSGNDPSVGDIAYYAPWGNLAIYYKDFSYAEGLIILGKVDSGVGALSGPDKLQVVIEAVE